MVVGGDPGRAGGPRDPDLPLWVPGGPLQSGESQNPAPDPQGDAGRRRMWAESQPEPRDLNQHPRFQGMPPLGFSARRGRARPEKHKLP